MLSWLPRRRKHVLGLLVVVGVTVFLVNYQGTTLLLRGKATANTDTTVKNVPLASTGTNKQACIHPKLNPFEGDMTKYFHPAVPIKCNEEEDWIQVSEGGIAISGDAQRKHGGILCYIAFLKRANDMETVDDKTVTLKNNDILNMTHDFFKAQCNATDNSTYANIHAGVAYRPDLHQRVRNSTRGLGLDVLMLGLDSLSHMTYIRKLKKTYKYFTENLGGIVLDGYNIVGDGTPQALIPILTGKTELELPRTLKQLKDRKPVDVYPMVWKDFRRHGYVTAWAEDSPNIGTFTYRMIGFKDQPCDHYMRPFYLAAAKQFGKHKTLCLGSKRRSRVFLDWLKNVYVTYKDNPKFVFGFHSEVSHKDNNLVETADDDILETLKHLYDGGYLKNTLLVLMSDHGARFSNLRATVQGKQEERLPFFGIAVPEWFRTKHSDAFKNLNRNAGRLTTPFDIYPTFLDLLSFRGSGTGNANDRSISLFKDVPKSRTCADAGIEPHWCACLTWHSVPPADETVGRVGFHLIQHINKILEPQKKLCAELSLLNITRAMKFLPETNMLKFKRSKDADGREADLSDNTSIDTVLYQIWIFSTPGDGHFEATVTHNIATQAFHTSVDTISRINKYGNDPKCIYESHEELRKYCFCKELQNN